ncbi:MAG: glycosyltransferase family 4 protein [Gammaproteobacteria bacterium]|nr:glycosyltransferase family 4 protein [Gammaproteobacteria bacterium]
MHNVRRPFRLCIFARSFAPRLGGLERIAALLAAGAAEHGSAVTVVTDSPGDGPGGDAALPYRVVRTQRTVARVREFRRADCVLMMNVSLPGLVAATLARACVVLSHHGIYTGRGIVGTAKAVLRRQLTRRFANVAVSHYVAAHLPSAAEVVPNGYDRTLFRRDPAIARDREFVFCGRLVSDKGCDVALRALAVVVERYPDARLTVVGDGPERGRLDALAVELGIASRVDFTGALRGRELVGELNRHVCLLVPSLWHEPYGVVAVEGIACCETVIASDRGGLPEALAGLGTTTPPEVAAFATQMTAVIAALRDGGAPPGRPADAERERYLSARDATRMTTRYLELIGAACAAPGRPAAGG